MQADPVEQPQPRSPRQWPEGSLALAEQLQRSLSISDREWHALKGQRSRRAAEQLAGALVLLLADETGGQAAGAEARQRAIDHASQALAWLKGEIRDPGCPQHGH
jgi:hypothetical protein